MLTMRAALLGLTSCAAIVLNSSSAAASNFIQPTFSTAFATSALNPSTPPPGINNYSCKLTSAHPRPVVLIHGTVANMEDAWGALGPMLANDGYCVFALNYGGEPGALLQGLGPVEASANSVAAFITHVREAYGVAQVDLVGHSQGGMLAEYVTKERGLAPHIHSVVALAPSTHGTTVDGLTNLLSFFPGAPETIFGGWCQACVDQLVGSPVITTLDAPPIAQPGVSYTVIDTQDEYVVTPVGSSFIQEPGVTNEFVQSSCWNDTVEHIQIEFDNTALRLVLNALSPSTARTPNCWISYPLPAIQQ
jgi:pimeloyl-ACP methyl ester carboxylesterase